MSQNTGTPGTAKTSGAPEPDRRELLKSALRAVEEMRARLESVEREASEPIAIIGLACRMPGDVETPEAFWDLLSRGVSPSPDRPARPSDRSRSSDRACRSWR